MHEFSLRTSARAPADVSMDEWRDMLMFDRLQKDAREYERMSAALRNMETQSLLRQEAVERTAEADATYEGPKPNSREARLLETMSRGDALPVALDAPPRRGDSPGSPDAGYDALMDEVFATMNRKAGA